MRKLTVFDPNKIQHHPLSEKIVKHLCAYCENDSPVFFRVMTAYFLGKVASQMRATIRLHNKTTLPINIYGINLAPSGAGKGKSMDFFEKDLCGLFFERFKDEAVPYAADKNIAKLSVARATRNRTDPDDERKGLQKELLNTGKWISSFDSATAPALKQFRHKLLVSGIGSLNYEIDEIGDNLSANAESLSKAMELYDKGNIKESLTKNTKENERLSEVPGSTPCNMLMFGTPSSLLDGAKTEDEFYALLEKGYARRSLFGFTREVDRNLELSAEEIYDRNMSQQSLQFVEEFADHLCQLADPINYQREIGLEKDEEILRIEYSLWCQDRAEKLSEFEVVKKIEMEHRWFKALKLAAAYAFIENSPIVKPAHFYNAVAVVEESGESFQKLLTRDRPYVKLAKYLGSRTKQVTQVELVEDLPFYKGTISQKAEMLTMAIAYGYQNNIIIKKSFNDGIEFLKGESLKETNVDKLMVSYSDHVAYRYFNDELTWDNLQKLTQMPDMHWTSHHVIDGHRCDDKTKAGFNLLVIDVDGGVPMSTVQTLLKDYQSIYYTTKRHGQDGEDRFRIILPMKYILKLDSTDYKEFMQAIFDWLPFQVDAETGQRSRKWLSHAGKVVTNDGVLFDPLEFIPKTTKNDKRKERLLDQQSMTNLERWFVNNTGTGNRSNQLIKYALLLVDAGRTLPQVEQAVFGLNDKLADKLPEDELMTTIMHSAKRAYAKQAI